MDKILFVAFWVLFLYHFYPLLRAVRRASRRHKHRKYIKNLVDLTRDNNGMSLNLALNYGSKSELISAFKSIQKNRIRINEKNLGKYLLTKNIPDPDLLIRTGNTKRLSNFLLWQLAYSEIFFEKKLWPDFNQKDYNRIIKKFRNVKRNFGRI